MTKKEIAQVEELKAQVEAAKQETRIAKALSWTSPVAPDVLPPDGSSDRLSKGWSYNSYSGMGGDKVARACSSQTGHSFGSDERTTTQGGMRLYSTELLALQALRHEVEKQVAKRLADIDRRIEKELALEASPNGNED